MSVVILLEYNNDTIKTFATTADRATISILKNYEFSSGKSIMGFLEETGLRLIESIDPKDPILARIENSNLPESITGVPKKKWYVDDSISEITPAELLDIGIKYGAFTELDIYEYIVSPDLYWSYEIQKTPLLK